MAVDIGTVLQAEEFIRSQDTGVLLGCEVSPGSFNDTTIGRAMDSIYSACTWKVFSQVAFRAASEFVGELDMRHVHFDTTSISVWGDKYSAGEDGLVSSGCSDSPVLKFHRRCNFKGHACQALQDGGVESRFSTRCERN